MRWIQKVATWLAKDRIRISPHEGQWLRLQVDQRIIWDSRIWRIDGRRVWEEDERRGVSYDLVELEQDPLLRTSGSPPIVWEDTEATVYQQANNVIRIDCFCDHD